MSPAISQLILWATAPAAYLIFRGASVALAVLDRKRRHASELARQADKLAADEALRLKKLAGRRLDLNDDYHGAPLFRTRPALLSFDDDRDAFMRSLEQIDREPRP